MFVGKKSRPRKPKQRHPRDTITVDGRGAPSHKEGDNKNPLRGPARERSNIGRTAAMRRTLIVKSG